MRRRPTAVLTFTAWVCSNEGAAAYTVAPFSHEIALMRTDGQAAAAKARPEAEGFQVPLTFAPDSLGAAAGNTAPDRSGHA